MTPQSQPWMRTAAFFTALSLLVNTEPVQASVLQATPAAPAFSIPAELGFLQESFDGPSGKTIYFIQDAHSSLEAQNHIAAIIRRLTEKHAVQTVFEEGYEGPVPTERFFGFIRNAPLRLKVSSFFLDKLRIGGAEFAHINRTREFKLIGADDLQTYRKNIAAYRKASKTAARADEELSQILQELRSLAARRFSQALRDWLEARSRLERRQLDLADFLGRSWKLLEEHGLKNKESENFPFLASLLRPSDKKNPPLDTAEVFQEIYALDKKISALLLSSEKDRRLFEALEAFTLLKRLNRLEVSAEEYAAARGVLENISTRETADFIARESSKSVVFSNTWEEALIHASAFYTLAGQRDEAVERTLRNFLKQTGEQEAALVFGGFHKQSLLAVMRRLGFSVRVISPAISSPDPRHEKYYHELMSRGSHPYERALMPALSQAARAARQASLYVETGGGGRPWVLAVLKILLQEPEIPLSQLARMLEKNPRRVLPSTALRSELRNTASYDTAPPREFRISLPVGGKIRIFGFDTQTAVLAEVMSLRQNATRRARSGRLKEPRLETEIRISAPPEILMIEGRDWLDFLETYESRSGTLEAQGHWNKTALRELHETLRLRTEKRFMNKIFRMPQDAKIHLFDLKTRRHAELEILGLQKNPETADLKIIPDSSSMRSNLFRVETLYLPPSVTPSAVRSELRSRETQPEGFPSQDLTEGEKRLIAESETRGSTRETSRRNKIWLFGEVEMQQALFDFKGTASENSVIPPSLYRDKKILIMPGYGNLPFLFKLLGAREVVARDLDPATIAWQKLKNKTARLNHPYWLSLTETSSSMRRTTMRTTWLDTLDTPVQPEESLPGMRFEVSDILQPSQNEEKFDLIVSPYLFSVTGGLETIAECDKALANLRRALAPGGKIIITPGSADDLDDFDPGTALRVYQLSLWIDSKANEGWRVTYSRRQTFHSFFGGRQVPASFAFLSPPDTDQAETIASKRDALAKFFESLSLVLPAFPGDFSYTHAVRYQIKKPWEIAEHLSLLGYAAYPGLVQKFIDQGFMMGDEETLTAGGKQLYSRTLWIDPENPNLRFVKLLELIGRGSNAVEGVTDEQDTAAAVAQAAELAGGASREPGPQILAVEDLQAWKKLASAAAQMDERRRSELRSNPPGASSEKRTPQLPEDELRHMRSSLRHYLRRQLGERGRSIDPKRYEFISDILPYRILAAKDAAGKILGFAFGKKGNRHMHWIETQEGEEPDGFIYEKNEHGLRITTYKKQGDSHYIEDVLVLGRFGDTYRLKIEESAGQTMNQSVEYHNWMPSYMLTEPREVRVLSAELGSQLFAGISKFVQPHSRLVLAPGMDPESRMTYWPSSQGGDVLSRERVFGGLDHEGFDLAHLRFRDGKQKLLGAGTQIPSLVNERGVIQWTFEDNVRSTAIILSSITLPVGSKTYFIPRNPDDVAKITFGPNGQPQFPEGVEYDTESIQGEIYRVAFVYTHLELEDWVRPGAVLAAGDKRVIGRIEKHRRYPFSPVVPHLHFAVMLFKESEIANYRTLNYEIINRKLGPEKTVLYVNPLSLLTEDQRKVLFIEGGEAAAGFRSAAILAKSKDALKSIRARIAHNLLGIPVRTAVSPEGLSDEVRRESGLIVEELDGGQWKLTLNSGLSLTDSQTPEIYAGVDALIERILSRDQELRTLRASEARSELRAGSAPAPAAPQEITLGQLWLTTFSQFKKRSFRYDQFSKKVNSAIGIQSFKRSFETLQSLGLAEVSRNLTLSGRPLQVKLISPGDEMASPSKLTLQNLRFLIEQYGRPGDEKVLAPQIARVLQGETPFKFPMQIESYEEQGMALAREGYTYTGSVIIFKSIRKLFGREYVKASTLADLLQRDASFVREIRNVFEKLIELRILESTRDGKTGNVWARIVPSLSDSQIESIEKALLEASKNINPSALAYAVRGILENHPRPRNAGESAVILQKDGGHGRRRITLPAVVRAIEEEELEQKQRGDTRPSVRLSQIAERIGVDITSFYTSPVMLHADLRRLGVAGLNLRLPLDETQEPLPGQRKPLDHEKARAMLKTMIEDAVKRLRGVEPEFQRIPLQKPMLLEELGISDTALRQTLTLLELETLPAELGVYPFKPVSDALKRQSRLFLQSLGVEPTESLIALAFDGSLLKYPLNEAEKETAKKIRPVVERWKNEQEQRRHERRRAYVKSIQAWAAQNYESSLRSPDGIEEARRILQVLDPNHPLVTGQTDTTLEPQFLVPEKERLEFEENFRTFKDAFYRRLQDLKQYTVLDLPALITALENNDQASAQRIFSEERYTPAGSKSPAAILKDPSGKDALGAFWKAWGISQQYIPIRNQMASQIKQLQMHYGNRSGRSELRRQADAPELARITQPTTVEHAVLTSRDQGNPARSGQPSPARGTLLVRAADLTAMSPSSADELFSRLYLNRKKLRLVIFEEGPPLDSPALRALLKLPNVFKGGTASDPLKALKYAFPDAGAVLLLGEGQRFVQIPRLAAVRLKHQAGEIEFARRLAFNGGSLPDVRSQAGVFDPPAELLAQLQQKILNSLVVAYAA